MLHRSVFQQDRQNPAAISRVFASGAMAGGICALLQTPVSEAIHCRMLCRIDTCNADRGHQVQSSGRESSIVEEIGQPGFDTSDCEPGRIERYNGRFLKLRYSG